MPLDSEGVEFTNWVTEVMREKDAIRVDSNSVVKVNLEGVIIRKKPTPEQGVVQYHYLYPSNEEVTWDVNLAGLQRKKPHD